MVLALSTPSDARKKPVIIAIIDTGFGYNDKSLVESNLCMYGHRDFTGDNKYSSFDTIDSVPKDLHGHGTNVLGIIDKIAGGGNYCFVVIKFFSGKPGSKKEYSAKEAIRFATALKPDIINFSGGGSEFSYEEYKAIERYLNHGGIFVAAAGNDDKDLGQPTNTYYPALYDPRIIVVGNLERNGIKNDSSNYGKPVKYWEMGTNIKVFGIMFTGTSQATAIMTGKIVKRLKGK